MKSILKTLFAGTLAKIFRELLEDAVNSAATRKAFAKELNKRIDLPLLNEEQEKELIETGLRLAVEIIVEKI